MQTHISDKYDNKCTAKIAHTAIALRQVDCTNNQSQICALLLKINFAQIVKHVEVTLKSNIIKKLTLHIVA